MKFLRIVKRFVFYLLLAVGVILIAGIISSIIFKDRIINNLLREANKHINTPIRVDKIDLNIYDKFPQMTISFDHVLIEESWENSTDPLLIAQKAYVILNPFDLLKGQMEINQIFIEGGEFFIKVNADGINNFDIISPNKQDTTSTNPVTLDLRRIILQEVTVHYFDARSNQEHKYYTNKQEASLSVNNEIYTINTEGDILVNYIKIEGKSIFSNKDLSVSAALVFNPLDQIIDLEPSLFYLENSKFEIKGSIETAGEKSIDLDVVGVDTDIQTLLSLLPTEKVSKFYQYQSQGDVYFSMNFAGRLNSTITASGEFGLNDATLIYPKSEIKITELYLTGLLKTSDISNPEKGTLQLDNIRGSIGSKFFRGNLGLTGFDDPVLTLNWEGELEVSELIKLFPSDRITAGSGLIQGNLNFNGKFSDLKSRFTVEKTSADGVIMLDRVSLEFLDDYPPGIQCSGTLEFDNPDLAIKNVSLSMGNSFFELNGSFKNILSFILLKKQKIQIRIIKFKCS